MERKQLIPTKWLCLKLWLVFSALPFFFVHAQIVLPDSVQSILGSLQTDSARTRYLNNLAWKHKINHPNYSEILCRYSLGICENYQDCYAKADATGILGNIADNHAHFEEAITRYKSAYRLAKTCGIWSLQASNLNNMGLVFQRQQRYDSAYIYLNQALALKQKIGNRASLASTLNNLGLVQYHLLHYREALRFFLESLQIKEEFNDRKSQGSTLLNISNIYKELGAKDSALSFLQRSIHFRTGFSDYLGLASSYNNLSILHKESGKLNEALKALDASETYARQVGDEETLAKIANNRSDIFLLEGKIGQAKQFAQSAFAKAKQLGQTRTEILALNNWARCEIADNNPDEAILKLELAMHIADSANDIVGRKETLKNLVAARTKAKQQPQALATLQAYQQLNDSVVYKSLGQELAEIQHSYEVLKARQEAKQLGMENKLKSAELMNLQLRERQKYWVIVGLVSIFVLLAFGMVVFLRLKQEKERQKLQTVRLEAREQERKRIASDIHDELGTHLSRIALSAETALLLQPETGQQKEVLAGITRLTRETIANLSELIWYMNPERMSLNQFLFREREQLAGYLQEFPISYCLEMELAEEVDLAPESQRQIHLILKEAIHNVVKHAQASEISVHVSKNQKLLTIQVSDNGKGFDSSRAHLGNGLRNLQLRAEQLHGKFCIESITGRGTTCIFEIPIATT